MRLLWRESGEFSMCRSSLPFVWACPMGEVLDMLDDMAIAAGAESFVSLPADKREQLARKFRDTHPRPADRLANWVMQCYYRDDRVLVSLGVAPRAPFPDGYDVQNGDWSKLDRVRARPPFYRRTT